MEKKKEGQNMSIKPRKIVAAALVLVLALSLLAACSGGTADTTP